MPACFLASRLVRARRKIRFASRARDVHTFWPSITQWSPSSTARVESEARSDPEPGSENPWHQRSSPLRIRGRNHRFWASVPHRRSVPPSILMPNVSLYPMAGTPARASSSTSTTCSCRLSPAPPYSFGHETPRNPLAARVARHRSTNRSASSRSAIAPRPSQSAGRCSSRNCRTRLRNSSASDECRGSIPTAAVIG